MNLHNWLTGKRWWYQTTLTYVDKRGYSIVSRQIQTGLMDRADILDQRGRKQELSKDMIAEMKRKGQLCNGRLIFHVVCYLGRMKRPIDKPRMPSFEAWTFLAYLADKEK